MSLSTIIVAINATLLKVKHYPAEVNQLVDIIVAIAINNKYAGYITIADEIKEDAKQVIDEMYKLNIQTVMLSGDKEAVVSKVAAAWVLTTRMVICYRKIRWKK